MGWTAKILLLSYKSKFELKIYICFFNLLSDEILTRIKGDAGS